MLWWFPLVYERLNANRQDTCYFMAHAFTSCGSCNDEIKSDMEPYSVIRSLMFNHFEVINWGGFDSYRHFIGGYYGNNRS
jgi:hypothetical protein